MKRVISVLLAVILLWSTVAINGIITVSAEEKIASVIDLIPAYGAKDMSIVMDTTSTGAESNTISDVTTASLTEIAAGTDGVPATNAYFVDINESTAKSGMMFEIDTDISAVMNNYLNGELYLDMWIWIADPSYFKLGRVRFFENRILNNKSYVEYQAWSSPTWPTVVSGWNHITVQVEGSGTDNNATKRRERAQLYTDSNIEYMAIYNQGANNSDYAVACARLISLEDAKDDSWDISVEGKSVYHIGDEFSKSDYIVTNKGAEVSDYAVSALDTTYAIGDTQVLFTVDGKTRAYPVRVKSIGASTYDSSTDTMTTMSASASVNEDNFMVGNSSIQFYNSSAAEITVDSAIKLSSNIDFLGEEYLEAWVYATEGVVDDSNLEFLIELSSGGIFTTNCYRFRWNNANSYCKFSDTFSEGWNLVKIPLRELHYNGSDVYTDTNTCQVVYNHDSNTLHSIDWTNINYVRARAVNLDPNGIILVNGIGFGIGTAINGESSGNVLEKTIFNAKDGDVVQLQNDYVLTETLVIDKDIILDLNRYSISGADIKIAADVTITDNNSYLKITYNGDQKIVGSINSNIIIDDSATLLIVNGEYNIDVDGATISGGIFNNTVKNCVVNGGRFYGDVDTSCTLNQGAFFKNDSYEALLSNINTVDADDASIKYLGNWTTLKNLKNANKKTLVRASKRGSTIEFEFDGTAFSINGYTSPTYGMISISIDGGEEYIVDLYSETAEYKKHIFGATVVNGKHKVKIKILDTKNPLSAYKNLFYAAIDSIDFVGKIIDVSETSTYETLDYHMTKNVAKFEIENAYINGVETSELTADADYGKVVVDGNALIYYAGAASDTITYSLNGISGVIAVTYDGNIEAEHAFDSFVEGEYKAGKYGVSVFNSWLFSGNQAVVIEKGETVEFTFYGESIEIIGYKSATYGDFELYIDGKYIETVSENLLTSHNMYENSLGVYTTSAGNHNVKIVALDKTLIDGFKFNTADLDNVIKVGSYDITNGYKVSYDYKIISDDIVNSGLDVVALQSVDRFATRSNYLDSVKIISQLSGLKYYTFVKAVDIDGNSALYGESGQYGIAILSKYPIKSTENWDLTSTNVEQRVLSLATIDFNGVDVNVFNTQLSAENAFVRETQFDEIDSIVSKYDNVIFAGNTGNASFDEMYQLITLSPVSEALNPIETIVDENVSFRYQDNLAYSYDFNLKSYGVSDEIHSLHYMVYAEFEYSPVTETVTDASATPSASASSQKVVYKTVGDTDISMTIYQPTAKVYDEAPLLVLFPGGGWAYCDISGYAGYYSEVVYARAHGWAVAVCEYRLCNDEQNDGSYAHLLSDCGTIGMVSDSMDAIRYLVKNSRLLGVDPTRIVTGGHSAGGYMSLITGLADSDDFVMDSALTEYNFKIHSITAKAGPTNFNVTGEAMADYKNLLNPDYTVDQIILCSPYYYISKNMAPTLICYGTEDEIFKEEIQWVPFNEKAAEVGATQYKYTEEAVNHSLTGSTLTYPAMVSMLDAVVVDAKTLN